MAQFRVEFVLDPASGKYLAELYHPERQDELVARTEARFASPEAALLGVVGLFKDAIPPRAKPAAKKKPARTPKKRAARAGTSARGKRRKRR